MSKSTQQLALDLERNAELAKLVAELEPGEKLDAVISIVAKNDKTLTVELESVSEHEASDDDDDDKDDDEDDDEESEGDSPAMRALRQ